MPSNFRSALEWVGTASVRRIHSAHQCAPLLGDGRHGLRCEHFLQRRVLLMIGPYPPVIALRRVATLSTVPSCCSGRSCRWSRRSSRRASTARCSPALCRTRACVCVCVCVCVYVCMLQQCVCPKSEREFSYKWHVYVYTLCMDGRIERFWRENLISAI